MRSIGARWDTVNGDGQLAAHHVESFWMETIVIENNVKGCAFANVVESILKTRQGMSKML